MTLEDGVEELALSGGLLRRKSWDKGAALDLEDIIADDWELIENEDEAD